MSKSRVKMDVSVAGTLYTIARIYDIGEQSLRLQRPKVLEYVHPTPTRTMEWMGYGLLLAAFVLVLFLAWPR